MAPSNINLTSPELSSRSMRLTSITITSQLLIPNAFSHIMQGEKRYNPALYDTCLCPMPKYNINYNLYATPSKDLPNRYSPYVFKELLYDNRPVIINKLPKNCVVAPLLKRPQIVWV